MPALPTNPHYIGDSGHVNDHNTIVTALSDAIYKTPSGDQTITANTATTTPLIVKGATSQSDPLFQAVNSAGTSQFQVGPDGALTGAGKSLGSWTSYTPTMTGGTGLNLGSTGSKAGYYCQIGKTVHYSVEVTFGGTGVNPGTSIYAFGLPVTATGNVKVQGSGVINDSSAGSWWIVAPGYESSTTVNLFVPMTGSAGAYGVVWYNIPFTFATGDTIKFSGTYEAA